MFGFTFEFVMRGATGDVQFSLSAETEECRNVDPAILGCNKPGARSELRGKLRCDTLHARGVKQIGLVEKHDVGAIQLVFEEFLDRVFMVRFGSAERWAASACSSSANLPLA